MFNAAVCVCQLVSGCQGRKTRTKKMEICCKFVVNLLAEGTEGVTEGFGSQMEQSLQEHVDPQGVESLPLI